MDIIIGGVEISGNRFKYVVPSKRIAMGYVPKVSRSLYRNGGLRMVVGNDDTWFHGEQIPKKLVELGEPGLAAEVISFMIRETDE